MSKVGSTVHFPPVEEMKEEHKYFGDVCLMNQSG